MPHNKKLAQIARDFLHKIRQIGYLFRVGFLLEYADLWQVDVKLTIK